VDPLVAPSWVLAGKPHDQLLHLLGYRRSASARLEPVQLAAGDLRQSLGPDAAAAQGIPQLPSHRQRVGSGRELEQRGHHRTGRPR